MTGNEPSGTDYQPRYSLLPPPRVDTLLDEVGSYSGSETSFSESDEKRGGGLLSAAGGRA